MSISRTVTEGQLFTVDSTDRHLIRRSIRRLEDEIRPTISPFSESPVAAAVNGLVGEVALANGTLLRVNPKVAVAPDWLDSLAHLVLLGGRLGIGVTGSASLTGQRSLAEAMARAYADSLRAAMRRDGPISFVTRKHRRGQILRGQLEVTTWVRDAAHKPFEFPTSFDEFSVDNGLSRALSAAALILASSTRDNSTRSSLRSLASQLRPGHPSDFNVGRDQVRHLRLPSQYAAYKPAWELARAILSRRIPRAGLRGGHGITIAVEAWPLLEALLAAVLHRTSTLCELGPGPSVAHAPKRRHLLAKAHSALTASKYVVPDGLLKMADRPVASFEAKYKAKNPGWPEREDVFQALATAAAVGSPLAVLVYPERFSPESWTVPIPLGTDIQLVALGLGMYSYQGQSTVNSLAEELVSVLELG